MSSLATLHSEGVALELDEQQRLVVDLGDSNIFILRNHGLLTGGASVELHRDALIRQLERAYGQSYKDRSPGEFS